MLQLKDIAARARIALWTALVWVISLAAGLAGSAQADMVTYTGTTAGEPTWNRPVAATPPTSLSSTGTAVPYSAQEFSVDAAGSYTFLSTATSPRNWDNYTLLYQTSFNPASPLTNALTGNDDDPSVGLSGFSFPLSAGVNYFFVTTGFGNSSFGAFSNTITGPGSITLAAAVPEPSSLVLVCIGLGAAAWLRRHLVAGR